MKKIFRTAALAALILAAALLFTGCLLPTSNASRPSVDASDDASTVPYEQRKLVFVQNASAVQVNYDMPVGFFAYEDNMLRILTPESKTAEHDDSISYKVSVFEKAKDGTLTEVTEDKYKVELRENGYLYLNSTVIGEVKVEGECANGSKAEAVTVPIQGKGLTLWDIVIGLIGLYLLASAVIGKGRLFDSAFVREGMEKKYKTIVRITALIVGLLMLASVALALLDPYDKLRVVKIVLFGVMLVVFIACMLLLRKCTDAEKRREAQDERYTGKKRSPEAAFVFDEDEPTVDDINNTPKE